MRPRLLAALFPAVILAGCGGQPERAQPPTPTRRLITIAPAAGPPPLSSGKEAGKRIARSVWAVVPDAPARKQELKLWLVRGSAVAFGTLLASGEVAGSRQVGIMRHSKFRLARMPAPRWRWRAGLCACQP